MRKLIRYAAALLAAALLLPLTALAAISPVAYRSGYSVYVDGTPVAFMAYALRDADNNDTNYLNLRDVAYTLSGTSAQFDVEWKNGAIILTTGVPYSHTNGTEMSTPLSGDRSYQQFTGAVYIDGTSAQLSAITLTDSNGGQYNHFKLRDLGAMLGFNVS